MTTHALTYPLSDLTLARRLEGAEGSACRGFVEARSLVDPARGALWRDIDGILAMYDGADSPITQSFGLGMPGPLAPATLDALEAFYGERGAPAFHEVSPLIDESTLQILTRRGYRPIELTSVMYRPIAPDLQLDGAAGSVAQVHRITAPEAPTWIETSVEGWGEFPELAPIMRELATVLTHRTDAWNYLAEIEGQPVASGSLAIAGDVALCAGASTLPSARRRGAQLALLDHRLRDAARAGCTLAMMCARPGSGSQRNAERHGFRIAYTRIKWALASAAP